MDASDPSDVAACPVIKSAQELTETWSSHDALQLSGVAKWPKLHRDGTALYIGSPDTNGDEPSSAGAYRFTRDAPLVR